MDLISACCDSRKLLNEILGCIQDAIIVIDLGGRILFSSKTVEKVLGFGPEELDGENLSVIFAPEDLDRLYPNLLHMAGKREPFDGDLMLLRKGGCRFFAAMVLRSYFDPSLDRDIIAVCIRDVHKEKQLEKTVRESHYDDLVQIANGIAHEIRNPLMGIGGFVNRILKSDQGIQNNSKDYNYLISNLKKIEDLVKKVEYFARIPQPCLTEESARELMENALEPYIQEIESRQIVLEINLKEMVLLVDKDLVKKAFSILMANALDALSEGGKIIIHNETDDIHAKIFIDDTGPGISSEDMPYIFNPFFSTKPDGVGIDLATAKRIMVSHSGSIEVASIIGQGASFTLLFPLERRQPLRILSLGVNDNK